MRILAAQAGQPKRAAPRALPKAPQLDQTGAMLRVLILLTTFAVLAGCAEVPPAIEGSRGFLWGLFDGIVAPIAFVVSWFSDSIGPYAVPNSGGWYDFGFLLGVTCWAGGGAAASKGRS